MSGFAEYLYRAPGFVRRDARRPIEEQGPAQGDECGEANNGG